MVNKEGLFSGSKVLSDASGMPLLRCKKNPLSRAKWTIACARSGKELCKTKTNPGLAKIAVEAAFLGRRESLIITPNFNDLSRCAQGAVRWVPCCACPTLVCLPWGWHMHVGWAHVAGWVHTPHLASRVAALDLEIALDQALTSLHNPASRHCLPIYPPCPAEW